MSWNVSLRYGDTIAQVENHEEGGTYALGGTTDADLNVTWNYQDVYKLVDFYPPTSLHGKKAIETIGELAQAIERLGVKQYARQISLRGDWEYDYYAPTPGNAGHALNILLGWARQHPDAVWCVG